MGNEPLIPVHKRGALPAPAIPAIPATVPGSVHDDLLAAGIIPDWNNGLNSVQSEWVNNRHWRYRTTVSVPETWTGHSIYLRADGLDDSGSVWIGDRCVGNFQGSLKRHEFDLSSELAAGESAELSIIFDPSPRIEGNCGFTSQIERIKPRFGYGWDWCAPLVNIGIWDSISLEARSEIRLRDLVVTADLDESLSVGLLCVRGTTSEQASQSRMTLRVTDENGELVAKQVHDSTPVVDLALSIPGVNPWWPANMGPQTLYELEIELADKQGTIVQTERRTIGFRRVRWAANDEAPQNALHYVCTVNGRRVFLRGVNWVPLSPFYGSPRRADYETRLKQYLAINANLMRVWGGGPLERADFYELCDQLGILVWQEFPLSSSLLENWPPENEAVIDALCEVATDYVQRRAHHPSLIVWCGGNELQGAIEGGKSGVGKPVDASHPCISRFAELLQKHDGDRQFFPASSSGPRFTFEHETRGMGLHHDVHGPWEVQPRAALTTYWNSDDSLLRSEIGVPSMARESAIRASAGPLAAWPPDRQTPFWAHHGRQWLPMEPMRREFGPWDPHDASQLPKMVRCSQFVQAESYRYAVEACLRRAYSCSGVLLWMGHDLFHMSANNSIIEHDGVGKLAYFMLAGAMAPLGISARIESLVVPPESVIEARIIVRDELSQLPSDARWRVQLFDVSGKCLQQSGGGISDASELTIRWIAPATVEQTLLLRCEVLGERVLARSEYTITQQEGAYPLQPLRELRDASVRVEMQKGQRVRLHNDGPIAAIGIWPAEASTWIARDPWPTTLLPGESVSVRIEALGDHNLPSSIELNGLNLPTTGHPSGNGRAEPKLQVQISPTLGTLRAASPRAVR